MSTLQTPVIQVKNLEKTFVLPNETIHAVKPCSFEIPDNAFTIIYGPSGSGKSTLLDALTGLEEPTKGSVIFKGQDMNEMNADQRANFRANNLGMVYQSNYWVASLSVVENVSMPLYLSGYTPRQARPLAMESLERVRVGHLAHQHPSVLSGGEQQRVSLARALVSQPEVIVADEPTGNLDTSNGDNVMSLFSNLQKELKKTIILVTHNLEYLPMSTHRVKLKDGVVTIERADGELAPEDRTRLEAIVNSSSANTVKLDGIHRSGSSGETQK